MNDNINIITSWLGTGSINIFGLPMSGKDTQGLKLAELLNAEFLSSGLIIRKKEAETKNHYTDHGALIPTDIFYDWVLPYFKTLELQAKPLILSSIGRWSGEEHTVIEAAKSANHTIKAAIFLDLTEEVAKERFSKAKELNDRGARADDADPETFNTRLQEFREKTLPVLDTYKSQNLLITVDGNQSRDAVFEEIITKLAERVSS